MKAYFKHFFISIYFLAFMLLLNNACYSQVTIAKQTFESLPTDNWNYTPPSQTICVDPVLVGVNTWGASYVHSGTKSCRAAGGCTDCGSGASNCLNGSSIGGTCNNLPNGNIVEFAAIDISCYANVKIELWHRSHIFCIDIGSGNGFDNSDQLDFEVNLNGSGWVSAGTIGGSSNYIWDYNTTPVGATSQVSNPYQYTVPAGTQSVAFRTRATVNRSDEVYYIDDAKISGNPSPPLIQVANNISICSGNSTDLTLPSVTAGSTSGLVFSYWWDINATTPLLSPNNITTPGTYYIKGVSAAGCFDVVPVVVSLGVSPATPVANLAHPTCNSNIGSIAVVSPAGAGFSYSIDGTNYSNTSGIFNNVNPGNYNLTAMNADGCISSALVVIINNQPLAPPPPTTLAIDPTCIVPTGQITISSPTGANIFYSIDGLNYSNTSGVFNGLTPSTIYQVSYIDANGCTSSSTNVQINSVPSAIVPLLASNVVSPVCPNTSFNLIASAGYSSYQWYLNSTLQSGNLNTLQNLIDAGSYSVTVTDANGCTASSTPLIVAHFNVINPTVISNLQFCTGDSVLLSVVGSYSNMNWHQNSNIVGNSNQIYVQVGGDFYFSGRNLNGCDVFSDTVTTVEIPIPVASLTPNDTIQLCTGNSLSLQAGNAHHYEWYLNGNLIPTINSNFFDVVLAGSYYVIHYNSLGCSSISDTAYVSFEDKVEVEILGFDSLLCEGTPMLLYLNKTFDHSIWSTGSNNPTITIENDAQIAVIVDSAGCTGTDSILVNFIDLPNVNTAALAISNCTDGVQLLGIADAPFYWSPALNLSNDTILNPIANPTATSYYTLYAEDSGCVASDSVKVIVDCSALYFPNAFSPNEDGINDIFKGYGKDLLLYHLEIFNRYGELVFSTDDIEKGWDGFYNGITCPDGIYVWHAEAFNYNNKRILDRDKRRGYFSLLR